MLSSLRLAGCHKNLPHSGFGTMPIRFCRRDDNGVTDCFRVSDFELGSSGVILAADTVFLLTENGFCWRGPSLMIKALVTSDGSREISREVNKLG